MSTPQADNNSAEEFCFEVPIVNLNESDGVDTIYLTNKVTADIAARDTDTTKEDLAESETLVIDETEGIKSPKRVEDSTNLIEIDDVVVLDGNKTDSDVIILERKTDSESTIILDDDEINNFTEGLPKQPVEVIDVEKDTDCSIVESNLKRNNDSFDTYKDNPLLLELIEKCFDMENTHGMSRVINRTLLVIYKLADEDYKKSEMFKKFLTRTIMYLDVEPQRKFSHIKNLCDELKLHKAKKRVPFITLKEKKGTETSTSHAKRNVETVINLDDDVTQNYQLRSSAKRRKKIQTFSKEYPPIEIDDDSSDNIDIINDNDVILVDKNFNSNKENSTSQTAKSSDKPKGQKKRGRPKLAVVKNKKKDQKTSSCKIKNKYNMSAESIKRQMAMVNAEIIRNMSTSTPGVLLEPKIAVEVDATEVKQQKIKHIEARIAQEKQRLEKLEKAEVLTDCVMSPYVQCETIKTTILKLYKHLCQLTGTEVNKRHEVRLQVVPGHPEGPVRCLEEFLNENIDGDGNPPFPDMHDVIHCVKEANTRYNMKWSRAQIVGEAAALFIQFGRKMQKRRQKREWKDLLSFVKDEVCDPAADDPELLAKLEENSRLARKKEHELLERFVNLEHGLLDPELRLSQSEDSGEESDPDLGNGGPINSSATCGTSVPPVVFNPLKTNENTIRQHALTASETSNNMNLNAFLELARSIPSNSKASLGNVNFGPLKTNENTVRPYALNSETVKNTDPKELLELARNIPTNSKASLGNVNFVNSVTVCDSKIVIQPTIKYGTTITNNNNNIETKGAPNNQITPYSSEFKSFIFNNFERPTNRVLPNDKFLNLKANSVHNKCAGPITISVKTVSTPKQHFRKITPISVTGRPGNLAETVYLTKHYNPQIEPSAHNPKNAETNSRQIVPTQIQDKVDAANLAKEILVLVQSDLCVPNTSNLVKAGNLITANNHCSTVPSFDIIPVSTNIVTNTISNNDHTKSLPNTTAVNVSNLDKQSNIKSNDFHITYATRPETQSVVNSNSEILTAEKTYHSKNNVRKVGNENDRKEIISMPSSTKANKEDYDSDANDIVKREPIDIPSNENDGSEMISTVLSTEVDFDNKDNISDANDIVKRETLDIPSNENDGSEIISTALSTEVDLDNKDNITDVNNVVKREPLDIPSNENDGSEMISIVLSTEVDLDNKDNVTDVNDVVKREPLDITSNENDEKEVSDAPLTEVDLHNKDNITNVNDVVKREQFDIPCNKNDGKEVSIASTTEADLDNITEVNDVVKRESLDIPSMLEELGEGYTATIFDIEDPFLIIEISDSSDSEDEADGL